MQTKEIKPITFFHPICIMGILLFFINDYSDETLNIPAGEFCFLAMVLASCIRSGSLLNVHSVWIAGITAIIFILWATFIDFYHYQNTHHMTRVWFKTFMFYAVIIGYIALPDKHYVFALAVGFLLGYIFNFFYESLLAIAEGLGSNAVWKLKYIIPLPAGILMIMLFFRKHISTAIIIIMAIYLLYSFTLMPFIGSRGAFLSLIVGLCFYAAARIPHLPRTFLILIILYVPLVPFTLMAFTFYNDGNPAEIVQWLRDHDQFTLSNVERSMMIIANITALKEHPVAGIGLHSTPAMIDAYYTFVTEQKSVSARSPHNYYMEFAVPFGLPALACILVIWGIIYRLIFSAIRTLGHHRAVASYCCSVIAWIMIYQPVAGITRLEVFMMVIMGLYGLSVEDRHKAAHTHPPPHSQQNNA